MESVIKCEDYDDECELVGSGGELCPHVDNINCLELVCVEKDEKEAARAEAELNLIFSTVGFDPPLPKLSVCADFDDCGDGCPGENDNDVCDNMCEDPDWFPNDAMEIDTSKFDQITALEKRASKADVIEGQLVLANVEIDELKAKLEKYDDIAGVASEVIDELNANVKELKKTARGMICVHCGINFGTYTADQIGTPVYDEILAKAMAHDAECPNHPLQKKIKALTNALGSVKTWTDTMENLMALIAMDHLE